MFYKALKEVCKEMNTSPSAVVIALGMSKSNVSEWKKGRSPRLDVVYLIAGHLGVSVSRLVPEPEPENMEG